MSAKEDTTAKKKPVTVSGNEAPSKPAKKPVIVNSHGITVDVDVTRFNDFELFDLIDEVQEGNVFKMPKLMRRVFGDKHEQVLEGLRNDEGIVTADKASEFLIEVLGQAAPNS